MTPDTFGTEHIGHPARQRVIETSRWLSGHADVDGPAPALQIPVQDQPAGRLEPPGAVARRGPNYLAVTCRKLALGPNCVRSKSA
jgi:hypothetical protein